MKEIDTLKSVLRQTHIADESRRENTAEHSWHIAMAAITLSEYADEPVDILRVLKMLLVHDIVEIDAGDTFAFDETGYEDKFERETRAANRIFGILPDEQRSEFMTIWQEFEAAETTDAIFAKVIDRVQPLLQNMASGGGSWNDYNVTLAQIDSRVGEKVARGAPELWKFIRARIVTFFKT